MSLTFSYQNVADQTPFIDATTNKFTTLGEVLPLLAMAVGLGRITDKNADEFFARVNLIERLNGAWRVKQNDDGTNADQRFTPEETRAAVGFYTNIADEPRAKWTKRITGYAMDDAARDYRRRTAPPANDAAA